MEREEAIADLWTRSWRGSQMPDPMTPERLVSELPRCACEKFWPLGHHPDCPVWKHVDQAATAWKEERDKVERATAAVDGVADLGSRDFRDNATADELRDKLLGVALLLDRAIRERDEARGRAESNQSARDVVDAIIAAMGHMDGPSVTAETATIETLLDYVKQAREAQARIEELEAGLAGRCANEFDEPETP